MKILRLTAVTLASLAFSSSALALDGCKVLLCLAGNWKGIAACVPPVREALWDMARGRAYPHCNTSGSSALPDTTNPDPNRADSSPTDQGSCPAMYSRYNYYTGRWASCKYQGFVSVFVDGDEWTRVFWDTAGETSTWYAPQARLQLGTEIDPTYDDDLAECGACLPPPPHAPER